MTLNIIKQIIQNPPEKLQNYETSNTNFVLHLNNEVICVNLTTKSEFQKITCSLAQGIKGVSI